MICMLKELGNFFTLSKVRSFGPSFRRIRDPLAEKEASFKKKAEQIPGKLDTGRLEEASTIWKLWKMERRIEITNADIARRAENNGKMKTPKKDDFLRVIAICFTRIIRC